MLLEPLSSDFSVDLPTIADFSSQPIKVREKLPQVLAFMKASQTGPAPIGCIEFSVRTAYYDDNTTHGDHAYVEYGKPGDIFAYYRDEELDDVPGMRRFERLYSDFAIGLADRGGEGDTYQYLVTPRYLIQGRLEDDMLAVKEWSVHDPAAPCPLFGLPADLVSLIRDAAKGLEDQETAILLTTEDSDLHTEMTGISSMVGNAIKEVLPARVESFLAGDTKELLVSRIDDSLILHGLAGWDGDMAGPVFAIIDP